LEEGKGNFLYNGIKKEPTEQSFFAFSQRGSAFVLIFGKKAHSVGLIGWI